MVHAVIRARIRGGGVGVVVESYRMSAYIVEYAMERRGVAWEMRVCM